MTITLTPEQEKFVAEKLGHGGYVSAEHVAAEAFQLLQSKEDREGQLAELRSDIETGWEQAERGELLDGPEVMATMVARARQRVDGAA